MHTETSWSWLATPWPYLIAVAGWIPRWWRMFSWWKQARAIVKQVRISNLQTTALRQIFQQFQAAEISGQPLPNKDRTDDRYELIVKFQGLLRALGYNGIIVLVDRVDEPHLINGNADQMRALLWPMLDNKFCNTRPRLQAVAAHRIGPVHRTRGKDILRTGPARQAEHDSIAGWTGEALYDVANARLKACAGPGKTISLRDLVSESMTERRNCSTRCAASAFRGTCSSSSTASSSRIATRTRTKTRPGASAARCSNRNWHCIGGIRRTSTAA